ncbi:MAG: RagB/SusD family nutrient uptake outer membrane protein [Bacteroides sp.]|nr:RagB/SusD family nutrient uptake outer membrane protein [Bacteroides sp.]MCM1413611.1 RagB/SusD family nutrient uptake outer membrane protein [Bacteroides sp.]
MKKIFLGLILSASMFTSCDMNTTNYGVLDQGSAIQSVDDAASFCNGLYVQMRSVQVGERIATPDIQMDYFVGLVSNGNRDGNYSSGQIVASDNDWADRFYSLYTLINSANYFIPEVERLMALETTTAAEKQQYEYFLGTAHFARAYAYWYLFDKLVDYSADRTVEGKGLQIVETYNPTAERNLYVGRSSINATVDYINNELAQAYTAVLDYENNYSDQYVGPNASYLNSYTVAALQARFAILTQDYTTALAKAETVINSGVFALCEGDDYVNLWINDEGDELLFVPYAEVGIGGATTGLIWLTNNKEEESDYIPTAKWLDIYSDTDVRFGAFFTVYNPLIVNGENYAAYVFNKYPGNPALRTSPNTNNMVNKAKPFRLSECYLIAAEAAAMSTNETKANTYLNDLILARDPDYNSTTLTGSTLLRKIKEERGKELIGEGFRLGDLRRWGEGMSRTSNFTSLGSVLGMLESVVTPTTNNVTYQPGDYRFVWPIPFREMQVNPQLTGQQNPRY